VLLFIFFAAVLLAAPLWAQEYSPQGNPLTRLTVKNIPVIAEVVSTPEKHYLGLSHRQSLGEGRGMLFVMGRTELQAFCMRDMLFAIDILWIADGKVAGIDPMLSPQDRDTFVSPVPVPLVLEVPAGFARRHGIKVGDPVAIKPPESGSKSP
jgi:uncharacterized membrane protein (UPF0127 family)